ncbi:hypothetical protein CRG98_010068 [Punica granatum]|uniref:Uncharacterized protein n=1 Tax=Punica granatum TaxID=22663 RepID=A0A2I0KMH6_PUNGR|nr:hypothetical protein CRG98_010068 [Punica granatum]
MGIGAAPERRQRPPLVRSVRSLLFFPEREVVRVRENSWAFQRVSRAEGVSEECFIAEEKHGKGRNGKEREGCLVLNPVTRVGVKQNEQSCDQWFLGIT